MEGAMPEEQAATAEPTTDPTETTEPTTEPLGEPGKKALEREREARKKAEAEAKANADAARKLAEIEESQKTETQKLTDRASQAESKAAEAEIRALKLEVALEKAPEGMEIAQIRKLAPRLAGTTREELEADADELFSDFEPTTETTPAPQRPQERLRSGTPTPIEVGDDDALAKSLKEKLGIR